MRGIAFYNEDFFVIKEDLDLISESITRLFMTNNNERVKNPFMGVDLRRMLFELADQETETVVKNKIQEQIEIYEPRVEINKLDIINNPNENLLTVNIDFGQRGNTDGDSRFLNFDLEKEI